MSPSASLLPLEIFDNDNNTNMVDIEASTSTCMAKDRHHLAMGYSESGIRDLEGRLYSLPQRIPCSGNAAFSPQLTRTIPSCFYQTLKSIERSVENLGKQSAVPSHSITSYANCQLWVEKYRPRAFTDLLTFDSEHLKVLQWATAWKRRIFGEEKVVPESKRSRVLHNDSLLDDKSILLLHGPPGLGKTTLAHLMAKVGGFNPIEINASDERSGEAVINKVKAALGANSIAGMLRNESVPNLIIIDEIDGAATINNGSSERSLITLLVKLANSAKKSTSLAEDADDDESTKKRKVYKKNIPDLVLNRPIICICNDVYAPALRPLRPLLHIIKLQKPPTTALAKRLREIGEEEGLKLDTKIALELAEIMEGDVRASIQALQFMASKWDSAKITKSRLKDMLSGVKDLDMGIVFLYDRLFTLTRRMKNEFGGSDLYDLLVAHGEYDRLSIGAFELYPHCKYYDDTRKSKARSALDWFIFLDRCSTMWNDSLSCYQPYTLLKCNQLFGSPVRQSLPSGGKFPQADYKYSQVYGQLKESLGAYQHELERRQHMPWRRTPLIIERIPQLANPQLLKADEKRYLAYIVNILIEEGLTFQPLKQFDGTIVYSLYPPVDRLARFEATLEDINEELPGKVNRPLNAHINAIRQMLANEIEAERIRSQKAGKCPVGMERSTELIKAYAGMAKSGAIEQKTLARNESLLKKDFFGRPISRDGGLVNTTHRPCDRAEIKVTPKIWYKYNEGFSNAVRKPIKIKNLFRVTS